MGLVYRPNKSFRQTLLKAHGLLKELQSANAITEITVLTTRTSPKLLQRSFGNPPFNLLGQLNGWRVLLQQKTQPVRSGDQYIWNNLLYLNCYLRPALNSPYFWLLLVPYWVRALLTLPIIWILKPMPSDNRTHSLCVWLASSRVGHRIKALKPCFWGAFRASMIGTRKAAVLPEPVGAQANTCLPCNNRNWDGFAQIACLLLRTCSIMGIACFWMGVGSS